MGQNKLKLILLAVTNERPELMLLTNQRSVLPEPGQTAEVGWDVLQETVIEAELGEADQLGAALGDLL
mgnify:CR=1 FL=1